jgi:hypothetical protein
MKQWLLSIFALLLCISFITPHFTHAEELSKNKFGIHITDIDEVEKAAQLVNSSGGDWGYVTFIINSNDRKLDKWQSRMNTLNEKHLIPIVRIATYGSGNAWVKPSKDDAHDWALFLNALQWPTKKRLVIVGNEPNHGNEWEGQTNPQEYARFLHDMIVSLKNQSSDFFILNAGFDSSTPQQPPAYMDQVVYMDAMEKEVPGIFSALDGWSSHSYPNPGFSGKPTDTGRGTIANYAWELNLLKSRYNVTRDLPVYITETGWVVKNSDHPTLRLDEDVATKYYEYAFTNLWLPDNRVVAVTPFLLTYKESLFSHFSWLRPDNSETSFYAMVRGLQKDVNRPDRDDTSIITKISVPVEITQQNEVIGSVAFKNTGNTIWTKNDGFMLSSVDQNGLIKRSNFQISDDTKVFPGQTYVFRFTLYTETILNNTSIGFQMMHSDAAFGEKLFVPIRVYKNPTLTIRATQPPSSPISPVHIQFVSSKATDTIDDATISPTGMVGVYKSKMFIPNQTIIVKMSAPNRDPVVQNITIREGENFLNVTLPPEKPWWQRLLSS